LYPAWSPDGRQIVFMSNRDGNPELYLMAADGTAPVRLTNHPDDDYDAAWRP
jgi:TolB protein